MTTGAMHCENWKWQQYRVQACALGSLADIVIIPYEITQGRISFAVPKIV
jgi:hypothetical protein